MSNYIVRFNLQQRVEHFVTMVTFAVLCLPGLPQKFDQAGWAHGIVSLLGGVDNTRWIHRVAGLTLALSTIVHFSNGIRIMLGKRQYFSMVPTKKDFEDAILQLRYYLGMTERHPRYDRYTYKEKFEYWGLVVGNVIMVATGFILFFPVQAASLIPGQFIPAAKVAHSNEGLMAFFVGTMLKYCRFDSMIRMPFEKCTIVESARVSPAMRWIQRVLSTPPSRFTIPCAQPAM